jgi:predicted N-acyltransferase
MATAMEITLHGSANDIAEDDWARLDHGDDPFASRAFLGTAEKVGASGTALGWQAQHIALCESEVLLGLLPLYLRSHSFGDFSRDWNWASAWQRAGLDYYPEAGQRHPLYAFTGAAPAGTKWHPTGNRGDGPGRGRT